MEQSDGRHQTASSEVEVSGLEPLSKRRAWRLSTRLSFLWFSNCPCREAGEDSLSLLS